MFHAMVGFEPESLHARINLDSSVVFCLVFKRVDVIEIACIKLAFRASVIMHDFTDAFGGGVVYH